MAWMWVPAAPIAHQKQLAILRPTTPGSEARGDWRSEFVHRTPQDAHPESTHPVCGLRRAFEPFPGQQREQGDDRKTERGREQPITAARVVIGCAHVFRAGDR